MHIKGYFLSVLFSFLWLELSIKEKETFRLFACIVMLFCLVEIEMHMLETFMFKKSLVV